MMIYEEYHFIDWRKQKRRHKRQKSTKSLSVVYSVVFRYSLNLVGSDHRLKKSRAASPVIWTVVAILLLAFYNIEVFGQLNVFKITFRFRIVLCFDWKWQTTPLSGKSFHERDLPLSFLYAFLDVLQKMI